MEKAGAAREIVGACRPIALSVLVDCTAKPPKALLLTSTVEGIFVCDMPGRNRDNAYDRRPG